jgi:hypothetical protein
MCREGVDPGYAHRHVSILLAVMARLAVGKRPALLPRAGNGGRGAVVIQPRTENRPAGGTLTIPFRPPQPAVHRCHDDTSVRSGRSHRKRGRWLPFRRHDTVLSISRRSGFGFVGCRSLRDRLANIMILLRKSRSVDKRSCETGTPGAGLLARLRAWLCGMMGYPSSSPKPPPDGRTHVGLPPPDC